MWHGILRAAPRQYVSDALVKEYLQWALLYIAIVATAIAIAYVIGLFSTHAH
jgi:hypothetical protein